MKNSKTKLAILFSCIGIILFSVSTKAQMVGTDAYMKGNYVEIGIRGLGGFEGVDVTSAPVPAGMHLRSANNLFGFVANPQMNLWAGSSFDGDFFTPGSPENGWGIEIDSTGGTTYVNQGNNCSYYQTIPGAITSWSYASAQTLCDWEGDATSSTNIHIKINYDLQDNDLFYITTISITNNTTSIIPDLYYYRNLDSDNNQEIGGGFTTQNTIVSQITMGGTNTSVNSTQTTPWSSFFGFLAIDPNWVAGYGGFSNRDAIDMWNGTSPYTQTVGATNVADEAIYLAYKITNLAPGNTEVFKFASLFDSSAETDAISALSFATGISNNSNLQNLVSIYPNPFSESTTIKIGKDVKLINAEMHIYDILGKEVKFINAINIHEILIDCNGLSEGMYMYKFINGGKAIASGKLLIK